MGIESALISKPRQKDPWIKAIIRTSASKYISEEDVINETIKVKNGTGENTLHSENSEEEMMEED